MPKPTDMMCPLLTKDISKPQNCVGHGKCILFRGEPNNGTCAINDSAGWLSQLIPLFKEFMAKVESVEGNGRD